MPLPPGSRIHSTEATEDTEKGGEPEVDVLAMRVVIVGAGAAGVFTAYRLRQMYGEAHEIILLERTGRVGGNTRTESLEVGGRTYSIDCGAQFFYRTPQPNYVHLLDELGLFESPASIDTQATGFTLWDRQANTRLLWVPSRLTGFLSYRPQDWARLIEFATFLAYAFMLDRGSPDRWTQSVDEWVAGLPLLDSQFKDEILRRFLYQFVTLPANRIGEASALYAITYFVRNVFGEPGADEPDPDIANPPQGATFEVYQSRIGLDGVLSRALDAARVVPQVNEPVLAVSRNVAGSIDIRTSSGIIEANQLVFATDPGTAATILEAGGFPAPSVIAALGGCEYADLTISMQSGGSCWMPGDSHDWEAVNTLVDGADLLFTVWFGALREADVTGTRIPVFKSWATPNLDPATCDETFLSLNHRILMPTTSFMTKRQELLTHQGRDGVWFAGGWTNWFDSQEAALDSATAVAERLPTPARTSPARPLSPSSDRARHVDRLDRWLARVAAAAPPEHGSRLVNIVREVETTG